MQRNWTPSGPYPCRVSQRGNKPSHRIIIKSIRVISTTVNEHFLVLIWLQPWPIRPWNMLSSCWQLAYLVQPSIGFIPNHQPPLSRWRGYILFERALVVLWRAAKGKYWLRMLGVSSRHLGTLLKKGREGCEWASLWFSLWSKKHPKSKWRIFCLAMHLAWMSRFKPIHNDPPIAWICMNGQIIDPESEIMPWTPGLYYLKVILFRLILPFINSFWR